ncbi:MAG: hypothetical protein ACK41E_03375 [Deinococcales bacterium]
MWFFEYSPRSSLMTALLVTPVWLVLRLLLEPEPIVWLEPVLVFCLGFGLHRLSTHLTNRYRNPNALLMFAVVGTFGFQILILLLASLLKLRFGAFVFLLDAVYWSPLLRAVFLKKP